MSDSIRSLNSYCKDLGAFDLLSREEEQGLYDDLRRGGRKARTAKEKLVVHNLRLVIKIANSYVNMGLDLEDLISEGNVGLWEAAKRYDPDKGAKFSFYSSFWIKQRIRKALSTKSRTIKVPTCAIEKHSKILKFSKTYEKKHGAEPTREQIAKKFNIPTHRVEAIINGVRGTISLDGNPITNEEPDSREVYESIADESVPCPDSQTDLMERARLIEKALEKSELTVREKFIVENRFGLKGKDRITLEKIGVELEITRERVRQLEELALWKMKNFLGNIE